MAEFQIVIDGNDAQSTQANYIVIPKLTSAEIAALTGVVSGSKVFNTTTNREQIFNVTWIDVAVTTDITGTNSGINTGDNSVNTLYNGLLTALIIPTANATTTLNTTSSNKILFTGVVFGTVLKLGDATTYIVGKIFNLYNNSTQTISITNNSDVEIYRLEPHCKLEVVLQDNTTSNGIWFFSLTYPNYDKFVLVLDDFISGTTQGQTVFLSSTAGAGSAVTQVATLFNRQGVNSLSTGTTNNGRTCLNKGGSIILFDNGVVVTEMSVRFEDLSVLADRYVFYAGFGDNVVAGDMLDGVYFEYAEGASGNFWRIQTANNATRTITVTTSPILADTWYKLKIEVAPNGTRVDFFVNDVNIGNITTNIPTTIGRNTGHLLKIEKTAGGNPRLMYVDYMNFKTFLTR